MIEDKGGIGTNNRTSGEISHLNKMNTINSIEDKWELTYCTKIKNALTYIKEYGKDKSDIREWSGIRIEGLIQQELQSHVLMRG